MIFHFHDDATVVILVKVLVGALDVGAIVR